MNNNDDHDWAKDATHPPLSVAERWYQEIELNYAVLLLRESLPYLQDMVGIASAMRILVPDIEEFLQHHKEDIL